MIYKAKNYAELLLSLTEDKAEAEQTTIIQKFVRLLKKHNVLHYASPIIREFDRLYRVRHGITKVNIESARELNKQQRVEINKNLPVDSQITTQVKPELLGGIKLIINDSLLIDGTLKHRLDQLFTID